MKRFRRLENIIRAVVWPLLHPASGAQALFAGNTAAAGPSAGGSSAPVPAPAPAWVTVQSNQRVTELGTGYVAHDGAIVNYRFGRIFHLGQGGERLKRVTLSSRVEITGLYVNQIAVRILDYKASGIIANLGTLSLTAGQDWVQSGDDVVWEFEQGQILLVEVLQNIGGIDINVEIECPVHT